MKSNERAVVTGATGFIGCALVDHLISLGTTVYCVCRPNSSKMSRLLSYMQALPEESKERLKIIELDLHDLVKLPDLIDEKCDVFYHLGWDGGVKIGTGQDLNILTSAMAILSAVKIGCRRFVASGSQAEYGLHETLVSESSTLHPVTPYGEAKVAAYFLTKTLAEKHGIEHIWCRIFSVYGPHENPETLVSYCVSSLLDGTSPQVTPCEQIWNYIFEDDAAKFLHILGTSQQVAGVYNLAGSESIPLKEYLTVLHHTIAEVRPDIPEIQFGARQYGFNQTMHLEPDISKLVRDTGFTPEISFKEGIQKIISEKLQ